jgi:hypothetical protein
MMIRIASRAALGLTAAALAAIQPANAAMSCWSHQEAAAARVRDLQSRLMVATMRCHAIGIDLTAVYNDFVRINRPTLQAANGLIKAQFAAGYGEDGETYYDRFATALANEYGDDPTTAEICAETAMAAVEAADAQGDVTSLLGLADRLGASPALPGGQCPVSFSALAE